MRALRASIPRAERLAAERAILRHLNVLRVFRPGARVAVYLSMPGEVSLAAGLAAAARAGVRLYAPRITSRRRLAMLFLPLHPEAAHDRQLLRHRGTARRRGPRRSRRSSSTRSSCRCSASIAAACASAWAPGTTTGRCAGASIRSRSWRRPRLIGVAYACQELPSIEAAPWDVPLDSVVTEKEIVRCRPSPHPT